jgi:hypothetical protein
MFYLIGYVDSETSFILAADLEIAKAVSSNRVDKRFNGEVMDDTVGSMQDENNCLSSVTQGKEEPEKRRS